jgi:putative membrane protein
MMRFAPDCRLWAVAALLLTGGTTAFAPLSPKTVAGPVFSQHRLVAMNAHLDDLKTKSIELHPRVAWTTAALVPVLTTFFLSLPAEAATGGAPFPSAIAAYVHYLSIIIMTACVAIERSTVKAGMSQDDQVLLSSVDIAYGISGLTLAISGYYRAVSYGKGFEFYAHEPVFWLKIALVGILGALSFFPTTKIIQRSIMARNDADGQYPEMSEALASRMQSVLNAELTALASIPLSATIMSRGIGYNDSFPWPVEAAGAALLFVGLGYKYVKEALDFED